MPTLSRFVLICLLIAAAVYGAMLALVTFVRPVPRDITVQIPSERLNRP